MKTVSIEPNFTAWREAARGLLTEKIPPQEVIWQNPTDQDSMLLDIDQTSPEPTSSPIQLQVSKQFIRLANTVSCHRSGQQWTLLYEILWAMTLGNNRSILKQQTNSTVRKLDRMRATISRDIHKMRAFVRFRQVNDETSNGREQYIAWFEPEHLIVKVNTPFFRKRFGGMNWSILTPDECVHWDGESITYSDGVDKSEAPSSDELEDLWRGYYRSIFNPARLKIKMMQTEMPKKYWKNLPEAEIIEELIQSSSESVNDMLNEQNRPLKPMPNNAYLKYLEKLNSEDPSCESTEN